MTSALERKADAFITKLAQSLAATATSTSAQPLPTQSNITTNLEQTIQSLPASKLRTHLLTNLPTYTTTLLHHYTQHLPTPPPSTQSLLTPQSFHAALQRLRGDVRSDVALCESLLICSNCPATVFSTYFRLQLSVLPGASLAVSSLHRMLSFHTRSVAALLVSLNACVEWAEAQLSQHLSPCQWLSATIDRLSSLFTTHARSVMESSVVERSAVLNRLCRLLVLGVVWRAEDSSLPAYVAYVTRTLAVWEQPPSAMNVDAHLLFLCQWCALLHTDKHEQPVSAAVSSATWLAASRLSAILAATVPAITRSLPLGTLATRSIALVRLSILHSILSPTASDLLFSHLSSIAALPLPPVLLALWPTRAVGVSVEQWVRRAKDVVGERTLLQQLVALGAVGSEVVVAQSVMGAANGAVTKTATSSAAAGQGEVDVDEQEELEGYGWFDDRRGDAQDPLDGQLHSLISGLKGDSNNSSSTGKEDEGLVDRAVDGMLEQTGETQPIAAEQQAEAQQEGDEDEESVDNQLMPSIVTSTTDDNRADKDDEQADADEEVGTAAAVEDASTKAHLPPPAPSTRAKKRTKADNGSVRISPRHTRSGTKL